MDTYHQKKIEYMEVMKQYYLMKMEKMKIDVEANKRREEADIRDEELKKNVFGTLLSNPAIKRLRTETNNFVTEDDRIAD